MAAARAQKQALSQATQASRILDGRCDKCRKKGARQRSAIGRAPETAPSIVHDVLRSPGQPLDRAAEIFTRPRLAYNFSRIPVLSRSQARIQAKLRVNAPGDIYEQEADRIADQVMATPRQAVRSAPPQIQRLAESSGGQMEAPASVGLALASPGRPLESGLRQEMEGHFGHDFSRVRVHTDEAAERSARDVSADAYTVGHNIAFGRGQFAPGNYAGRRLISHELAHVVQQSGVEGLHLDQIDENHDLLPISLTIQRKECASDFPCLRLPIPPGIVRFQGCTNDQLKDYAIIPEDGTETVTPTNNEDFDSDGFFFRHRQPPTQWFKIPSHCDTTITCEGNDFSCLKCCNLAASLFKGSPRWTSDLHDAANPFDQSTSAQ